MMIATELARRIRAISYADLPDSAALSDILAGGGRADLAEAS